MADPATLFRTVIAQTEQFIKTLEQIEFLADRFSVDASLAQQCADAAATKGRPDLLAVDFNNWLASVAAMSAANVGNVKAFFYKML